MECYVCGKTVSKPSNGKCDHLLCRGCSQRVFDHYGAFKPIGKAHTTMTMIVCGCWKLVGGLLFKQ